MAAARAVFVSWTQQQWVCEVLSCLVASVLGERKPVDSLYSSAEPVQHQRLRARPPSTPNQKYSSKRSRFGWGTTNPKLWYKYRLCRPRWYGPGRIQCSGHPVVEGHQVRLHKNKYARVRARIRCHRSILPQTWWHVAPKALATRCRRD